MGRRKNRTIKNTLLISGITTDNKYVVKNIFWFKNTHGIQLSDILKILYSFNMVIDWTSYVYDSISSNNKNTKQYIYENIIDC